MKKEYFFIFICFYVLTFSFPFYLDDWRFSEAQSINYCIERTISFYNNWNGRIIPNFFGFWIVSLWPNWLYALWTTVIFVCYVALISIISEKKIPVAIIAVMIFLLPAPFECLLWRIGNVNYLYAALFLLLILWLYSKSDSLETKKTSILINIFAGFITGITHEAVSLPLLGAVIIHSSLNKGVSNNRISLIVGLTVGTLVNVLCPGTFVRSASVQSAMLFNICKFFFSEITTAWFSIITIILLFVLKRRGCLKVFFKNNMFLFILWIVNILFLFSLSIKSILVYGRVIYFQEVIAFIITLKIVVYLKLPQKLKHIRLYSMCLYIFITLILGINIWNLKVNTEKELSALEKSNDEVVKADILPLSMDFNSPDNRCFSRLYNRKSIIGLKGDLYNDMYDKNKLSIDKVVLIDGKKWFNYSNVLIREIPKTFNVTEIQCTSTPFIKFAPDFVNKKLSTIQKHEKCQFITITNPYGVRYLLVYVGGNPNLKRTISIIIK